MTDFSRAAELVTQSSRILALTGAGLSTASGIPDLRPAGRWTLDPDAEKISTLSYYLTDEAVRRRRGGRGRTRRSGRPDRIPATLRWSTWNVRVGWPESSPRTPTGTCWPGSPNLCTRCTATPAPGGASPAGDRPDDRDGGPGARRGRRPRCPTCGGITRATVILFEEALDADVLDAATSLAEQADLVLAVGTSLTVHPVAGLVPYARRNSARVVIVNAQRTPYDGLADAVLRDPIEQVLPRLVRVSPAAVHWAHQGRADCAGLAAWLGCPSVPLLLTCLRSVSGAERSVQENIGTHFLDQRFGGRFLSVVPG